MFRKNKTHWGLERLSRYLEQMYNNNPSKASVFNWIERFPKEAIKEVRGHKPQVGSVWVADEPVLKIEGE